MSKSRNYPISSGPRALCTLRSLMAFALCIFISWVTVAGQNPADKAPATSAMQSSDSQRIAEIERRLNELTATVGATSEALRNYLSEIQTLRVQLNELRSGAPTQSSAEMPSTAADLRPNTQKSDAEKDDSNNGHRELAELHDEQVAQQSEIKQLDQTKVEVLSKYPLRVSGLVLFNAFSNIGVVDNAELPAIALGLYPGSSHGSNGATLRQTLLSLEAFGPRLAGARTSANVSMDFFGGSVSNAGGYAAAGGALRMRQSKISMDWDKSTITAGYVEPLISPLSPDSFATVAAPSLTGSGNLWTWSPQLSIEQRLYISDQAVLGLEAGLIYPASPGYTSTQLISPIEASRRPAYEGRLSYRATRAANNNPTGLEVGVGAYSGRQFYNSYERVHSWAVTGDWRIPITPRSELSGEIYRGRAIGGLGGGAYKDIVSGVDTTTGFTRIAPVEAAGGWSQLKFHLARTVEANAIFGLDDALASSFDALILDSTVNPFESYARNRSIVGNVIFRPKTYLLISPEYRRIRSWHYTGPSNVADIFTISAGYQF